MSKSKESLTETLAEKARRLCAETLNRFSDVFIKFVFTRKGREKLIIDFLNAVFEHHPCASIDGKIVSVKFLDREILPSHPEDRLARMDLVVETDKGAVIDIEVQNYYEEDFGDRSFEYLARLMVMQDTRGIPYGKAKGVVVISLSKHALHAGEKWHRVGAMLYDDNGELCSGRGCVHFLKPPKSTKIVGKQRPRIMAWLDYFSNRNPDQLADLMAHDEVFSMLKQTENEFLQSDAERYRYVAQEMAERDYESAMFHRFENGRSVGHNEGHAEGRVEGISETAFKMFKAGFPFEVVQQISDLDIEQLRILQAKALS